MENKYTRSMYIISVINCKERKTHFSLKNVEFKERNNKMHKTAIVYTFSFLMSNNYDTPPHHSSENFLTGNEVLLNRIDI